MRLVSQDWILSSAMLLLLAFITLYPHTFPKTKSDIKSAVFLSPKFELAPGSAVNKFFYNIEFPRGHIAVKSFDAELVDEAGNPVPLHETYLHHWIVDRYHQRKHDGHQLHRVCVRNSGICQDDLQGQYFGFGSESRGTSSAIPYPFGIEIGNPEEIPDGYEEIWVLNVHAIDTRGVEDELGCVECRCDLYNVTRNENGQLLRQNYSGGLQCCYDNTQCRVREGFQGPKRNLYLKYKVKWVDWDNFIVPVKIYVLDVTDTLKTENGSKGMSQNHQCQVEYDVESCNTTYKDGSGCFDVKRTSFSMQTGGYVIYGVAHQHSGGIGSTLYGQDGRVVCSSIPHYGKGKEAGDEEGYIVGMSTCYPQPGSVKIIDGETLTLESNYSSSQRHTGVMGLFYLLVAEQLPRKHSRLSSHPSFFANVNNIS